MTDNEANAAIADALATLGSAIKGFDRSIYEHVANLSWEEAALLLRHVQARADLFKGTVAAIESRVIQARREERVYEDTEVDGVGVVSVHRSKNRRGWDNPGLSKAILEAHLAETEGEMPAPWVVRDWIMDAAGIGYWKVTALAALGIDADDYCDSSPGRAKVDIVGGPTITPDDF